MIDLDALERIKQLDLPALMQGYGLILKPAGRDAYMVRCPFHEDKTPSLSIGKKGAKWLWNCFGCRAHGNYLDFRMAYEKLPFIDALQKCAAQANLAPSPAAPLPVRPAAYPTNAPALLARAAEVYHQAFLERPGGRAYLGRRGVEDAALFKRFHIGYVDGRLSKMLPGDPAHETNEGLKATGILNDRCGEKFYNCVTFPITDDNGAVVELYGRNIASESIKHLYSGPHRGVWNGAAIKAHQDIILTEGIIDALSLHAVGLPNAVALYGTNGLTENHLRLMKEHRTRRVYLCLDNDDPGDRARPFITERLKALGVEVFNYDLPKVYKDANDALVKGFKDFKLLASIQSVLARAEKSPEPIFPTTGPSAPPASPAAAAPAGGPTVEEKDGAVFINFGRRTYRVRGLTGRGLEHLRVNVKVESPDGNHLDTLDLYSSKARDTFVSCCEKIIGADAGELHREVNRLIEVLEARHAATLGEDKPEQERPMTAEEEAEALAALKSPTLLPDILRDMESLGYVGEEANKAIGYLAGISRKLDDPLSCVLMSQSAAGKSVLAETVEKLTPPEEVMLLSRLTSNGLFWMKRDALKHKLLILEERVGAEAADYSIRTLQSKKKLVQAVPVKNEKTGQIETRTFEVEGPIAYIETTTRPRIADDNATRCFELSLDESAEQTRRIHEVQRRSKTLDGLKENRDREKLCRRHWNMQRLLKPVRVVIPYAAQLDFPTTWLRTRRDHMRFLNLIEVVCFLHQHQRQAETLDGEAAYIAASLEDYRMAYDLAGQVMGEGLTELKKPQRRLLEAIRSMGADGVTRREIREHVGLSDARLRVLLDDLVALDHLRLTDGGGQGKICRYRWTDLVEGDERRLPGLTTPEELAAKLKIPAACT